MTITLLNTGESKGISHRLEEIRSNLSASYTTRLLTLNQLNIDYCTGCWSCWWKTPGRCALKDDGETVFRHIIQSDFVLFAAPLKAGFPSAILKTITDRLVVLLHPYITLIDGECHHHRRYDSYPLFGLLLEKEADTDATDVGIVNHIYDRFAINFHSKRKFTHFTDTHTPYETADTINHI